MRGAALIGIVLIVLGVVGLGIGYISYTKEEKVLDVGPLQVTKEEKHSVPIPTIASIIAIVAGLGLVIAGRRSA